MYKKWYVLGSNLYRPAVLFKKAGNCQITPVYPNHNIITSHSTLKFSQVNFGTQSV